MVRRKGGFHNEYYNKNLTVLSTNMREDIVINRKIKHIIFRILIFD